MRTDASSIKSTRTCSLCFQESDRVLYKHELLIVVIVSQSVVLYDHPDHVPFLMALHWYNEYPMHLCYKDTNSYPCQRPDHRIGSWEEELSLNPISALYSPFGPCTPIRSATIRLHHFIEISSYPCSPDRSLSQSQACQTFLARISSDPLLYLRLSTSDAS